MQIRPLHDRVLIEPLKEEVTAGGIIMPSTSNEKPQFGVIISVGPGKSTDNGAVVKCSVTPGDKVIYSKYAGTEVKVDGKEMLMMKEEDIMGVVEN
jgi:chaperonin GroES